MNPLATFLIAAVTTAYSGYVVRLAYRDYLRQHQTFLDAVRELSAHGPLSADVILAMSPLPPLHRLHRIRARLVS